MRSVLSRLAALGLGLAASFFLAEGFLRMLQLAPVGGIATVTASEFDRVPGIFSPDQRVIDRQKPELPHVVTINSLGYRGSNFPRSKAAAEYRIVMLGDSFTFGDFVDDTATLPAQLERELRR